MNRDMEDCEAILHQEEASPVTLRDGALRVEGHRQDLLRRFRSTPFANDLQLMGRTIRVESNESAVVCLAVDFFQSHQHGTPDEPEFTWRLMCERDARAQSTAVPLAAFSDVRLGYMNIGQRGFVAVDSSRREAAGYLSDAFVGADARLRHRPPLDILFCMTAPSLGLVALSGGCVGRDGRGVMVFGAPNAGKTTSCYLAARSGLEFQADQLVFLDARLGNAWGDPFPAVFRLETLNFLPELQSQVHHSSYQDSSFCYFDKSSMQPSEARPIQPVCSLFLNRDAGCKTELREIQPEEAELWLRASVLFEEDPDFEEQISSAIRCLTEKPVYELRYDSDPAIAAAYIEKMVR